MRQRSSRTVSWRPGHPLLWATAAAWVLRMWQLGGRSLWLDEAILLIRLPFSMIEQAVGLGELYHPPLYYELMRPWVAWFGTSEVALRLPSALLGTAVVPLVYWLGRTLNLDRRQLGAAVWLTACSPLLIWYAQEARSYAILTFLHLLGTAALATWASQPGPLLRLRPLALWLLFGIATGLALYLHYAAPLIFPLQMIVLVIIQLQKEQLQQGGMFRRWPIWMGWLAGWGLAILSFVPWLLTPVAGRFWGTVFSDSFYLAGPISRMVGLPFAQIRPFLLGGAAVLGPLLLLGVVYLLYRLGPRLHRWLTHPTVIYTVCALFLLLLVIMITPRAYSIKRQLSAVWPLWLLLVGWLVGQLPRRRAEMVLVGAAALATLITLLAVPKANWRAAAAYLQRAAGPDDVVLLMPGYNDIVWRYYDSELTQAELSSPIDQSLAELADQYETIWYVEDQRDLAGPRTETRQWLNDNRQPAARGELYLIQITGYRER